MYHIDSKVDKPDIQWMENRVKELMARGISVGSLDSMLSKYLAEQEGILEDIRTNYGIQNPNSSKQIVNYISKLESAEVYEACCIEGKWTTSKASFSTLSLLGYQFATDILAYRKVKKYADAVKSMKNEVGSDGRVHPQVSLAKTNRINYSKPALMNIPKPLLWHIIKPNNVGNYLYSADIKNQEPSILINLLNAEELKEALRDEHGLYEHLFTIPYKATANLHFIVTDGHEAGFISNTELCELGYVPPVYYTPTIPPVSTTYYKGSKVRAIDVTNIVVKPGEKVGQLPETVIIQTEDNSQHKVKVIWDKYNKQYEKMGIYDIKGSLPDLEVKCEGIERKEFKTAWNAMTYGASRFGVKAMCKHIDGDAFYNYFSKIPEFKKYSSNCKKMADAGSQRISTFFGTPLVANEYNPSRLRRQLMDLPIQGTAADILSLLLKHIDLEVENRSLTGKLMVYYTRHDEIIFELDKGWADEVGEETVVSVLKDIVEHQIDDWVPFKVEVGRVEPDNLYFEEDEEAADE